MREFKSSIKIGISACLTGDKVRFDKSHKKSTFCMQDLSPFVEYRKYCPEVAVGLPVPRPTIRQVKRGDVIHVSRPDGSMDVTTELEEYGREVAQKIDDLSGFIFTAKSPSCGMERVKVYYDHGLGSESTGIGAFSRQIMEANPLLPCEENGRLNDAILRENFVTRVFAYKHWQELVKSGLTKHKLIQFHSQYKYQVMSHHYPSYQQLGRLLGGSELPLEELAQEYITGLMNALKHKSSKKTHTNTLQHLQGYFKGELDSEQRTELREQIDRFRDGLVPLLVPLTLIQHFLKRYPKPYLENQVYLAPHPEELKLRYGY